MKNRFLLLLLLLCTFGLAGNSFGQGPDWTGPAAVPSYTDGSTMSLFVTPYIDGQPITSDNYVMAAFMGDEVCQIGPAWSAIVRPTGEGYYFSGNTFGYKTVSQSPTRNRCIFKLWDTEANAEAGTSTYEFTYNANEVIGTPTYPLVINFYTEEPVWEQVTDASTLAEGDVIAITNVGLTKALGEQQSFSVSIDEETEEETEFYYRRAFDITAEGDGFTYDATGTWAVQEILVHFDSHSSTNPLLFASMGYLYSGAGLQSGYEIDNNYLWSITTNDDGTATLETQGSASDKTIRCTTARFSCYGATDNNPVCIYRKVLPTPVVEYDVTATATPADGGSIQMDGAVFTGGTYEEGTELTLTAVPAEGYNFVSWTVNGTELTETIITIEVTEALTIVATFEEIPVVYYTLTYNVDPTEAGTIAVTPAAGEQGYEAGTTVTLTATPTDETWIFDEWQNEVGEAVSAMNPYEFAINENTALVAKFHQEIPVVYYTLTVNVNPAEAGSYTVNPTPGDQGFEAGTEVTVAAVPTDETWAFVKWRNAIDETLTTEAAYTFTIEANTTLFAEFEPVVVVEPYTVTLNPGSGTCTVAELTEAEGGAGVTLPEATPCDAAITAGYTFAGWAAAEVAETTTAPELFNGEYHPEADITLYAVYAMGEQTYTFKNGDKYLAWVSNNSLSTKTEVNDNSKWNVTFDGEKAIISPITQEVEREIAWNNQTTGQRFAAYKHTSLYNNDGSMSANYGAITLFKDGVAVTSLAENDVVVLASETVKKELSTVGNYGTGADYEEVPEGLYPLTVGIEGEPATYNSNPSCEGPVVTQDPVISPNSGTITDPSVMVEITCPTEGAVIYYTLDGSTPTAESTVYTAAIEITETTTVSAIAIVEGGEPSNVVTATYTFPEIVEYPNIAAFKAAYDATSTEIATITGDVTFVFRSGRYMYVQDETAALLIYDNSTPVITNTYENGDVISGGITGTMNVYNGQKELVPTTNPAAGVAGTPVEPTVVTAADVVANYADYDAMLVKMEGVTFDADYTFSNSARSTTFTQDETNYTVYSRFNNLTVTVEEGQEGDVTGFIGIHNDTKQMYPRNNEDIELVELPVETVIINATASPAIGGTVEGADEYEVGEEVTLIATPAEGYVFVNWTEGDVEVGTDATLTFTAEVDRDLVANFEEGTPVEPEIYMITVTIDPEDAGTVTGAGEYEEGATVTLNATAAEGYEFWKWMEGTTFVGSNPILSFTAEADRDLIAMFKETTPEPEVYTITVLENENGTVTAPESAEAGVTIDVTATPNEGYILTGLYYYTTDEEETTDIDLEAMSFVMPAANVTIGAEFTEETPEPEVYTITVLEVTGGTVTAPATAEAGETINVTATPAVLHALTSLYYYTTDPEDVTEIDLEAMSFEMPAANVTIGAVFASTAELGDANNDDEVNILDVLAVLNHILGKNPQPFDFEQADMNEDGVIDISDAMAINALIHGMKANCGEEIALYDVVDGQLMIEAPVALAGYQFHLSAEPVSNELAGFSTMGNWVNGEYILLVFNLNSDHEAGLYTVLNLGDAQVNSVALATMTGCKVIAEKGTLSVNSLEANFKVYPVPATTTVTVEGEGINFIEVYNVMGQRIMSANTQEVNVSALSAGTYMFRIYTDNGVANKNVVIVR